MRPAALTAAALLGVVGMFQIALALGAPMGKAAWGGRQGRVLPKRLRIASAVAGIVVYPLMILFVLASSGLVEMAWLPGTGPGAMWVFAAFFAVGALANFASPSRPERLWGPVSLAIAICCAVVAVAV